MRKHTKVYLKAMGYDESDFIPCEICNAKSVDIHHIDARGMGGAKDKDTIENIMALCRSCHVKYEGNKSDKEYLKQIHLIKIHERCTITQPQSRVIF
jgi:5-methylcytosine-specific restriction endonuclease McrA